MKRFLATLGCIGIGATGLAQPGRIQVDVEPVVESAPVSAGSEVRAALTVRLPEGFHVNSNEPLEKYLIPTSLAFVPMDGVEVGGVATRRPSIS